MPRLPRVTAVEVERALANAGFLLSRQKGSHRIWIDANLTRVVVPFHAGTTIGPKLLKRILRLASMFCWIGVFDPYKGMLGPG